VVNYISEFLNIDCLPAMKKYPDNFFDLAIVDPPYFSGPEKRRYYGRKVSPIGVKRLYGETSKWEVPDNEYFDELFRISKHQIIWGVNYFDYNFGAGRIVWDKVNGESSFSDCEIAYCSFHDSVRLFRYMWNGMMQGKSISEGHIQQGNKRLNEKRIHPTQKPVNLYRWLVQKYAKEGYKILDTHVGSASSLIAFEEAGLEYVGFEKDEQIFKSALARLEGYKSQLKLF
jgi:site-specific DNA-methyltransferase (adenine-specific)